MALALLGVAEDTGDWDGLCLGLQKKVGMQEEKEAT